MAVGSTFCRSEAQSTGNGIDRHLRQTLYLDVNNPRVRIKTQSHMN